MVSTPWIHAGATHGAERSGMRTTTAAERGYELFPKRLDKPPSLNSGRDQTKAKVYWGKEQQFNEKAAYYGTNLLMRGVINDTAGGVSPD
jgi:hypothetical protein